VSKKSLANLADALDARKHHRKMPDTAPAPATSNVASYIAPSRVGTEQVSAHLPPDFKRTLRLIHAKTGRNLQKLLGEALNDLFRKYNEPTVEHEGQ
jgi:hypothetical protein